MSMKEMIQLMCLFVIVVNVSAEAEFLIKVNYDIGQYKLLQVGETLELICKNLLNRDPPSWTYPIKMYNDPRLRFYTDGAESRLVISNAQAEDAGQYRCEGYNLKTFRYNKIIEVIDFDNKNLNPKTEAPDEDDDYWMTPDEKVVIDESYGRWTLGPYKLINNEELIIANATEYDNGKYYCVATSVTGEQTADCTVKVKREAPRPAKDEIEANYDIGHYKLLQINQTLELICKNKLNRDPPSWRYNSRLYRDPRMKLSQDVGESRLVISNAKAEDAGPYECENEHEYNGKTFRYKRKIEVIVNEISEVQKEETEDYTKLLCDVQAYPIATVIWKIDYDNKELNPQQDEPVGEDDYWIPPDDKVIVDNSEGRWTLRPYKGVNNAELIIADATENDNGIYYCVARNLAGEQCKNCTVTRSKRGVAVKSTGNSNAVKPETENSQEGLGVGTITTISVLSLIFIVIILVILGRRMIVTKFQQCFRSSRIECWKKSPSNDVPENAIISFSSTAATSSLPADEPCDATKLKGETECTVQVSLHNKLQQESWDD